MGIEPILSTTAYDGTRTRLPFLKLLVCESRLLSTFVPHVYQQLHLQLPPRSYLPRVIWVARD